jgi:hypothetical protein
MNDVQARLDEVRSAPRGRRTAAFFDFDGTMIDGYSAMVMMEHRARRRDVSPVELGRLMAVGMEAAVGRADFERFMRPIWTNSENGFCAPPSGGLCIRTHRASWPPTSVRATGW